MSDSGVYIYIKYLQATCGLHFYVYLKYLVFCRLTVWEHGGHHDGGAGRVSTAQREHEAQVSVLGLSVFCLLPDGSAARHRCECVFSEPYAVPPCPLCEMHALPFVHPRSHFHVICVFIGRDLLVHSH